MPQISDTSLLFAFKDSCKVEQLDPGVLTTIDNVEGNSSVAVSQAGFMLSNCTISKDADGSRYGSQTVQDLLDEIVSYYGEHMDGVKETVTDKLVDPFNKSVIMANFTVCSVVVSAWMLFIAQMLSITFKPMLLRFTTVLLAVTHTYLLHSMSKQMQKQFYDCNEDSYDMIYELSNSTALSAVIFVGEVSSWMATAQAVYYMLRELRPPKRLNRDYRLISFYGYLVALVANLVFIGIMHFYALPYENYPLNYAPNVVEICLTCLCYVYQMGVLATFITTRISFSFKWQSLVLISLLLLFTVLAIVLNMVWLFDAMSNLKWLIGAIVLFQTISTNLAFELLANWKLYDRQEESQGIVGREIHPEDEADGGTA